MKTLLRHYGRVIALLATIALLAGLSVWFVLPGGDAQAPTVVTTVYPLYVAARNVLGDTTAMQLENLTGSQAGCLHDYQLSPANRIALERATLVLLNGAGAEPFLEDVLPQLTAMAVDTGEGISLLTGEGHHHEHTGEAPHDHEDNSHIWTSPRRYGRQVLATVDALCAVDPANAHGYTENGMAYYARVDALATRVEALKDSLQGRPCVLLHESLAYLADDLGLTVAVALAADEEGGLAAGDLARAQDALIAHPDALLLYDGQYTTRYTALEALLPAGQVLIVDTAIRGDGEADDWLEAMEKNVALFAALTEE